jgi:hypothetical protein
MNLGDLVQDERISFNAETSDLTDKNAFRRDFRHLERYGFWTAHRRGPTLWDHERAAIVSGRRIDLPSGISAEIGVTEGQHLSSEAAIR